MATMTATTMIQQPMIFVLVISATLLLSTVLSVPLGGLSLSTTTVDPIGEAFRKQLSADSPSTDDKTDSGGTGARIFIDRLTIDEIREYRRTGRLPSRTEALIRDFLHKSPQGRELLNMEQEKFSALRQQPTSDPVPLQPSDRYEIVHDGGQTLMIPNEDDFSPSPSFAPQQQQQQHSSPSLTSIDQRRRRRRRA